MPENDRSRRCDEWTRPEQVGREDSSVPVAEIVRKRGISRNTHFGWRRRYAGATVPDLKRLQELEAENSELKRMYTDLALENAAIKELSNRKL